ncbi:MAG: hypothetical protein RLZZ127_1701 [Planctomycetota bacterium]|jgi:hypothetical protein
MTKILIYILAHVLIPFLYSWIRPYGYSFAAYGTGAVAAAIAGVATVRLAIHGSVGPTAELVLWGVVPALAILANHLAFVIWGGLRPPPAAVDAPAPAPAAVAATPPEEEGPDEDPAWVTIRVYASSAEQYGYLRDRDRLDEAGIPYRVVPAGAAALQVAPADAERACDVLGIAADEAAPAG